VLTENNVIITENYVRVLLNWS